MRKWMLFLGWLSVLLFPGAAFAVQGLTRIRMDGAATLRPCDAYACGDRSIDAWYLGDGPVDLSVEQTVLVNGYIPGSLTTSGESRIVIPVPQPEVFKEPTPLQPVRRTTIQTQPEVLEVLYVRQPPAGPAIREAVGERNATVQSNKKPPTSIRNGIRIYCDDEIDNDRDGLTDKEDPDCGVVRTIGDDWDGPSVNDEDADVAECSDGVDNDDDGNVDTIDAGCTGPFDWTEGTEGDLTECNDGKDNDGDGDSDRNDPGCADDLDGNGNGKDNGNGGDNSNGKGEGDGKEGTEGNRAQCGDKRDNDGDGKIDLDDMGCENATDNTEDSDGNAGKQCNDGKDNDGDGRIDRSDPGCDESGSDDSEDSDNGGGTGGNGGGQREQCNDNIDNDGDGRADFQDPECRFRGEDGNNAGGSGGSNGGSTSGTNGGSTAGSGGRYDCSDRIDNDGDGRTDFPADLGCRNRSDDSEESDNEGDTPECRDGRDNDSDGLTDFFDPDCRDAREDGNSGGSNGGSNGGTNAGNNGGNGGGNTYECNDGRDNDGDGRVDLADPGCRNLPSDDSEDSDNNANNGGTNAGNNGGNGGGIGCSDTDPEGNLRDNTVFGPVPDLIYCDMFGPTPQTRDYWERGQ